MEFIEENAIPAFLESTQLTFELESVDVYNTLIFPAQTKDYDFNPQVEVPYNIEKEQNTQKSVDKGHSPWRLDPLFTTQVFVSMQLYPDGIEGEYPIEYGNLKLIYSTDRKAIVEVKDEDTVITTVYLERLIKPDHTGIWTAIGYDTIDK